MGNWLNWVHGLLAAAVGAIGTAISGMIAIPETFNFSHAGLIAMGKMCGVSAVGAAALYLKQSPLPAFTVTRTKTETSTLEVKKED